MLIQVRSIVGNINPLMIRTNGEKACVAGSSILNVGIKYSVQTILPQMCDQCHVRSISGAQMLPKV